MKVTPIPESVIQDVWCVGGFLGYFEALKHTAPNQNQNLGFARRVTWLSVKKWQPEIEILTEKSLLIEPCTSTAQWCARRAVCGKTRKMRIEEPSYLKPISDNFAGRIEVTHCTQPVDLVLRSSFFFESFFFKTLHQIGMHKWRYLPAHISSGRYVPNETEPITQLNVLGTLS